MKFLILVCFISCALGEQHVSKLYLNRLACACLAQSICQPGNSEGNLHIYKNGRTVSAVSFWEKGNTPLPHNLCIFFLKMLWHQFLNSDTVKYLKSVLNCIGKLQAVRSIDPAPGQILTKIPNSRQKQLIQNTNNDVGNVKNAMSETSKRNKTYKETLPAGLMNIFKDTLKRSSSLGNRWLYYLLRKLNNKPPRNRITKRNLERKETEHI